MRVLIVGYYGQWNLGDDAFLEAIPLILGQTLFTEISFRHVNQYAALQDVNQKYDIVLVGGGDVVVPYFLDRIKENPFTNGPVLLFGAGITYPSCISLGHIDQFDKVLLRNTTDLRIAERRLGIKHVHYIPDTVFALRRQPKLFPSIKTASKRGRPLAGFFPIAAMFEPNPDSEERQQHVLYQLAKCIKHVTQTHDVHMVRFNTSGKRSSDDKFVCEKLLQMCKDDVPVGSLIYDDTHYKTPCDMLQCMSKFEINICMRFHAHVFSIVQQVPFVSLALTRKVRMLMDETGLAESCAVHLDQDSTTLRAQDLPFDLFLQRFEHVTMSLSEVRAKQADVHDRFRSLLLSGVYARIVHDAKIRAGRVAADQESDKQQQSRKLMPKRTIADISAQQNQDLLEKMLADTAKSWQRGLRFSLSEPPVANTRSVNNAGERAAESTFELTPIRNRRKVERKVTRICKRAIFGLTGQLDSSYLWGFVQNMLQNPFDVDEYMKWIWSDHQDKGEPTPAHHRQRCLYFDYMQQQEGRKAHRSGWPFVVEHMRTLESKYGVLCDMYVDRTFHWSFDVLRKSAIVPYTRSWVGFVHHTTLQEYSDFNVVNMLDNPMFRASLLTCRGLFVLSNTLKEWFDNNLAKLRLNKPIKVRVLRHPTQMPTPDECFSMRKFLANKDRKLVNIGAWLRDTFALYDLALMDNAERAIKYAQRSMRCDKRKRQGSIKWRHSVGYIRLGRYKKRLRRCILRGRNMGLYMPPEHICIDDCQTICDGEDSSIASDATNDDNADDSVSTTSSSSSSSDSVQICRHKCGKLCLAHKKAGDETKCTNKWIEGLREHVDETLFTGVDVLHRLSNEEYDRLLQENIVFLCLKDASACNTLVECVVRNTPLLINKLPAVEEVLGPDYPFYYENLSEALLKSRDCQLIDETHNYLCGLDKTVYRIESFIDAVRSTDVYQQL